MPEPRPTGEARLTGEPGPTAGQPASRRYPHPWRALPVVLVGVFMAILDVFVVLVAVPALQADLHAGDAAVQLVLAGYGLAYAVALVTGSRLGDRYGRRRVFVLGMAGFTLASAACGAAPGAGALVGFRVAQGLAAALMVPQVFTFVQVLLPPEARHRAFAALGLVIGCSTVAAQLLGGLIVRADVFGLGWRPVFLVNVPVGAAALVAARFLVPESRSPHARRLDLPGIAVLSPALVLLVVPVIEGRELGWPVWTWPLLAAGVALLAAFARVERRRVRRGGDPLVDPALFGDRPFACGVLLVAVYYMSLNSFFLVLSTTLQAGLGLSPFQAGLVYTPQAVAFFAASLLAGRLVRRHGRRVLHVGAVTTAAGFASTAAVSVVAGAGLGPAAVVPTLVVQGVGMGLLQTPLLQAVLAGVRSEHAGMASGVLSTVQQVGGALGVALVGVVFYRVLGTSPGPGSYVTAFAASLGYNVAVAVVAACLVFALPRKALR